MNGFSKINCGFWGQHEEDSQKLNQENATLKILAEERLDSFKQKTKKLFMLESKSSQLERDVNILKEKNKVAWTEIDGVLEENSNLKMKLSKNLTETFAVDMKRLEKLEIRVEELLKENGHYAQEWFEKNDLIEALSVRLENFEDSEKKWKIEHRGYEQTLKDARDECKHLR